MDAGKIFLSAMLGGVKGGAEGYSGEADKQRSYALKQLELNKPPSEIQSLRSIYPDFDENQEDKEARALNYRAAGAGVEYKMPTTKGGKIKKIDLSPPPDKKEITQQDLLEAQTAISKARALGLPAPQKALDVQKSYLLSH